MAFGRLSTSFTPTVRPRVHFASLSSFKSEVWPLLIYSHIAFNYELNKESLEKRKT